ncbi:MAG: DNA methyltransferase, partial [Candidatus Omnitrophota bacterium]|nr:DNA methyltransferase [Candidatus Omnitrophota bacterium]
MLDKCFNFVLAYPRSTVGEILDDLKPGKKDVVLDPFCGTGTTLLECKFRGIPSIGIEINPVCVLASRVKISWDLNLNEVRKYLDIVVERAQGEYVSFLSSYEGAKSKGEYLSPLAHQLFKSSRAGVYLIKSGLIQRGWISPRPA